MNIQYIAWRLLRRMVPLSVSNFLLRRNFFVKISLGTTDPAAVAGEYESELRRIGRSVAGKKVLEFGYGGSFGTAVEFLNMGAAHVYLFDKFAKPNNDANLSLAAANGKYFFKKNNQVFPNPEFITLLDSRRAVELTGREKVDFIFSRAVLEHVVDPANVIAELGRLTAEGGAQVHFIDLRDHYFKFSYEMLCYGSFVWKYFLNPAENLNRLRLFEFIKIFKNIYRDVSYRVTDIDLEDFKLNKRRIKKIFLSGDDVLDAAQRAWIVAF